jgi:Sec-independent protein translocase protein TatA
MFAFLENLSLVEIGIVIVVAVMVFGGKLPEAAGQAAAQLQKLRRSLTDLKRETGIDRELADMRRSVEQAIPRVPRIVDVPGTIERRFDAVAREAEADAAKTAALPEPTTTSTPPTDAQTQTPATTASEAATPADAPLATLPTPTDLADPQTPH